MQTQYRCPENELRQLFSRYGRVQTCIVNKDKRHAFVKMFLRKDAEAAKIAMEDQSRTNDMQLRVCLDLLIVLTSHANMIVADTMGRRVWPARLQ